MATVSLRELGGHLRDAQKRVDEAINSDEDEPKMDFDAVRNSLVSALSLFPEDTVRGKSASPGAADSACGYRGRTLSPGISDIFPWTHPQRNHSD